MANQRGFMIVLFSLVFAVGFLSFASAAQTLTVNTTGYNDSSGYHASGNPIQDAITSIKYSSGDTIIIEDGTYEVTSQISTNLDNFTIKAADGSSPVIEAQSNFNCSKGYWVIRVNQPAEYSTIEGLKILGNGYACGGIYSNGDHNTVKDNQIEGVIYHGIMTSASAGGNLRYNTISGNAISNVQNGIALQSDGNYIDNNTIDNATKSGFSLASKSTNWGTNTLNLAEGAVTIHVSLYQDNYSSNYSGSIQDAINGVGSSGIISTDPGTFDENINMNKAVTIIGNDSVIKGQVTMTADNSALENFTIGSVSLTGTGSSKAAVYISASNILLKNCIVENVTGTGGGSIEGIYLSASSLKSNLTIESNVIKNISNTAHGSYGMMIQNAFQGVNVLNNVVSNISNNNPLGWTHGIEVTPSCSSSTLIPKDITLKGNSISNIFGVSSIEDEFGFTVDWCNSTSVTANASEVSFNNNNLNNVKIHNVDPINFLDANNNYWGSNTPNFTALVYGNVNYSPWVVKSSSSVSTTADVPQEVNTTGTNSTINFTTSTSSNGTITVQQSSTDPQSGFSITGASSLGKFITITSTIPDNEISNAEIRIYYTPAEVLAAGLDENTLKMYYYNTSTGSWEIVADSGVNTTGHYVYAITNHFSDYGVGGTLDTTGPNITLDHISNPFPNPHNASEFTIYAYANITDPSGVQNWPELKWKETNDSNYHNAPMSLGADGLYYGGITAPKVDGLEVDYKITAVDSSNNSNSADSSPQYEPLFTYDGSAPVTTDNASSAWTNQDVVVNITCSDSISGCNKTYYSTDGSNPTTLYSGPFTLSAPGQYQLRYYSIDNAGNVENVTNGTLVRIDKVDPTITIAVPTDGAIYNYPISSFNYTANDTVSGLSSCWYNKGTTNSTPDTSCSNFTLTPVEGSNTWTVYANDSAGNLASAAVSFVVDTINPNISYNSNTEAEGKYLNRNWALVNISANDTHLDKVVLNWNGTNQTLTANAGNNYWYNETPLTDGIYTFQAFANDSVNNRNETSVRTVTIDTTKPTVSYVDGTLADNSYVNADSIFANISVDEANFKNETFRLWNSTGLYNTTNYTSEINQINWTGLAEGKYTYNVVVYDLAGNSNVVENRTITLDRTDPVVTIVYPANQTYNTSVSQLNYTFNETSPSECWYSTDKGVTNQSMNSCTANFTGVSSVEGLNNWTVYMNDSAGNLGMKEVSFTKDTVNPLISFGSGTTTAGNYSQSYIESNVSVSDPSPGTGINRTVTYLYNSTNVFSFTNSTSPAINKFTGLADGTYYLNATTWDNAGNSNSTAETKKIVLDTTAPFVNITQPMANGTVLDNMTAYTIKVNSTDFGTGVKNVEVILSNSTGIVASQNMSKVSGTSLYESTIYLANLPSDNYTIEVTSTDYAGNKITELRTFEITDNVAQLGEITTINNQVSPSAGGKVSFVLPVTVRGNGTIVFGMDDLAGYSPSQLNATISSGNQTAKVGEGSAFTGATTLTLNDSNPSLSNIQGNVTLTLDIPGNNTIPSGSHSIHYYINNA